MSENLWKIETEINDETGNVRYVSTKLIADEYRDQGFHSSYKKAKLAVTLARGSLVE